MDIVDQKRNSNDFSFTDTFASLVNNDEFKEGYVDFKNGIKNEKSYIWEMLSAVSEEVGETIYENVLNYIDNVSNINTCKLYALRSIAKSLGVKDFYIFNRLDKVPLDILNLLDIFSINRRYLLDDSLFSMNSIRNLIVNTFDFDSIDSAKNEVNENRLSNINSNISNSLKDELSSYYNNTDINVIGSISEEKYKDFLSSLFYATLINHITDVYVKDNNTIVSGNLSSTLSATNYIAINVANELQESEITGLRNIFDSDDAELSSIMFEFKKLHDIPYNVDYRAIAYNIDHGIDVMENYTSDEQDLINTIFKHWSRTVQNRDNYATTNYGELGVTAKLVNSRYGMYELANVTRYSVYKEQLVKSYFNFIEDINILSATGSVTNIFSASNNDHPYELDKNYTDITYSVKDTNSIIKTLELTKESFDKYRSGEKRIPEVEIVANILTGVCLVLVNIRERLKSQAQKNHMIGTRLLVEYILSQYLKTKLQQNYPEYFSNLAYSSPEYKSKGGDYNTEIPNYIQDGFYANIIEYDDLTEYYNLENENSISAKYANPRQSNVNSRFYEDLKHGTSFYGSGTGLGRDAISSFYMDNMGIKSDLLGDTEYYDFLSTVFEMGNDRAYIGSDGLIVLPNEISTQHDQIESGAIFLKYHGLSAGYYPWYNFKNQYHSSRQVHPFLYQFVEHENISFAVGNAFYSLDNEKIMRLLQSEKISTILGRFGSWIDVWKNELMDYSGYKSRYENSTHTIASNSAANGISCVDYDGTFYPKAVEEYLEIFDGKQDLTAAICNEYNITNITDLSNFEEFTPCIDGTTNSITAFTYGNKHRYEKLILDAEHLNIKRLDWELEKVYLGDDKRHGESLMSYSDGVLLSNNIFSSSNSFNNFYSINESETFYRFGRLKSFYSKWYKHLDLNQGNGGPIFRRKLRYQLQEYYSRIKDLTEPKEQDKNKYDIYAYGLDTYNNSYILYKPYKESYYDKKNALGELWFRYKDHPIGFPAFDIKPVIVNGNELINIGQIELSSNPFIPNESYISHNNKLQNYLIDFWKAKNNNKNINLVSRKEIILSAFYDFDFPYQRTSIMLAAQNTPFDSNDYSNPIIFANKLEQQRNFCSYLHDKSEFDKSYLMFSRECDLSDCSIIPDLDGFDFKGFCPSDNGLYAIYTSVNIEENLITSGALNVVQFIPESANQPVKFKYDNVPIKFNNKIPKDTEIAVGYVEGRFSLALQSNYDSNEISTVQNYIGYNAYKILNSKKDELSAELDGWTFKQHGRGDYLSDTIDRENDINTTSFDRFNNNFVVLNIPENYLLRHYETIDEKKPYEMNYVLNPDASYIPLYSGVKGQIKTWPIPSYDKKTEKSIDLLGYSFENIQEEIDKYTGGLIVDPYTNKVTDAQFETLLSSNLRVYEDYNESDYVQIIYNRFETRETCWNNGELTVLEQTFDISDKLLQYPEMLCVVVVNTDAPTAVPIITCSLFDLMDPEKVAELLQYDGDKITDAERYIYENGYPDSTNTRPFGTPNVFEYDEDNEHFSTHSQQMRINRIRNIKDFNIKFEDGKIKLYFTPDIERMTESPVFNGVGISLSSKKVAAIVYDIRLNQFEKYHYMEPFDKWPYFCTDSKKINEAIDAIGQTLSDEEKYWYKRALFGNTKGTLQDFYKIVAKFKLDSDDGFVDVKDAKLSSYVNKFTPLKNYFVEAIDIARSAYLQSRENGNLIWNPDDNDGPGIDSGDSLTGQYRIGRGALSSELEDLDLSQWTIIDGLSSVPYIRNNQITFKISEEDDPRLEFGFPPTIMEDILNTIFGRSLGGVKDNDTSIYSLSNTFIFQLDNPFEIANILSSVPIPVYSYRDNFNRAYEDYLSAQFYEDENGPAMTKYLKMYHCLDFDYTTVLCADTEELCSIIANHHEIDNVHPLYNDEYSDTLDVADYDIESMDSFDAAESVLLSNDIYPGKIDVMNTNCVISLVNHKTTAKEIDDFLKLYVCYKHESNDTITLYFNQQNITNTPYLYRNANGDFVHEYKQGTYLTLKSGQSGNLNVVLQYKYIDVYGEVQGVTSITVARYKIFNVSDDKPKFLISRTWRISDKDLSFGSDFLGDYCTLIANDRYYGPEEISSYVSERFKLLDDIIVSTTFDVESNSDISALTCEFLYDTGYDSIGNTEFEIIPELCENCDGNMFDFSAGDFVHENGYVKLVMRNGNSCRLAFKLKEGITIPTETFKKRFNIDIIKANAVDTNGLRLETYIINGSITFDFIGNNSLLFGRYLARELNFGPREGPYIDVHGNPTSELANTTNNYKHNSGWILTEADNRVINIYNGGYDSDGTGKTSSDDFPIILETEDGFKLQFERGGSKYTASPIYI